MPPARTSERQRAALAAAAGFVWIALLAIIYPLAIESVVDRLGVRGASLGLAAVALASLVPRAPSRAGRAIAAGGLLILLSAAVISQAPVWLRLLPAWAYACLAAGVAASLRAPQSLVERAARWLVPEAPDFIGGYCRTVSALWSTFFLLSAALIAGLAVGGSPQAWRAFTGGWLWIAMLAAVAVEFLVRKTWFRYYARGGPFERLWSTWFPAERTARGRRSLAAIARWQERMAADSGEPSTDP